MTTEKIGFLSKDIKMKKIKCIYLLLLALVVTLSTSCSHDESTIGDKLEEFISNDVDFVFAGNLKRVLEVTDSEIESDGTVKLSDYMEKMVATFPSSVRNGINDILDAEGFDWTSAVIGARVNSIGVQTLCVWSVKDEKDYANFFVDKYHFRKGKSGDYTILYDDGICIAIQDKLAFLAAQNGSVMSAQQTVRTINDWKEDAKDNKIANWKCNYLENDDVFGILFNLGNIAKRLQDDIDEADFYSQTRPETLMLNRILPDARKVTMGATFNIDGFKAKLKGKLFTSNGKEYKLPYNGGKFNGELLKYATDKDMFVLGASNTAIISDLLSQSVTGIGSDMISNWLNNFGGSLMVATGLRTSNLKDMIDSPTESMHWILAAECKPEKAAQTLNLFANIIPFTNEIEVTKHVRDKELRFRIATSYKENTAFEPWEDGYYVPVYTNFLMKIDGNVLLLSNEEIDPRPTANFTADMFKGKDCVAVLHLAKNEVVMRDIIHAAFGLDFRMTFVDSSFEFEFSLNNTKKGLLETFIDLANPAIN